MTSHSECNYTERGAERRAMQLMSSSRNKASDKLFARLYFPNGVREARSADLLRRTIRNDFPFGMHFTKQEAEFRVLERRAAQPRNSKRNKDLEKTTVRNYFPNGFREACSTDLICRAIRHDFP